MRRRRYRPSGWPTGQSVEAKVERARIAAERGLCGRCGDWWLIGRNGRHGGYPRRDYGHPHMICGDCLEVEEREILREEERERRRAESKDRRFGHLAGHRRSPRRKGLVSPAAG